MARVSPMVTVVVPAYNAEPYITQAVSSVLGQSLPELEVIVVDDGSTDGTRAVLAQVADPRLRVIADSNHGPAHARNQGCRAASPGSRYIAFLDADDWWDEDKLREQVHFLDQHPELAAAGSFMRYVSSSGRVLGRAGQVLTDGDRARVAAGELFPFPMSSLVVRRSVLAESGLFDETFRYAGSEDLDFVSRLAGQGPVQCVPRVLGSYRVHPASAMARERLRINFEARFVRARIARRAEGGELSWDEFRKSHRFTAGERWRDWVEVWYREAALQHGERRHIKALTYGALALLASPAYTLRRLVRQRLSRSTDAKAGP